jgi:hypothetical protein
MDATSGAGTAYPSAAPEFTPGFQCGSRYLIFSFICMFCRSLFEMLHVVSPNDMLLDISVSQEEFEDTNGVIRIRILLELNLTEFLNKRKYHITRKWKSVPILLCTLNMR